MKPPAIDGTADTMADYQRPADKLAALDRKRFGWRDHLAWWALAVAIGAVFFALNAWFSYREAKVAQAVAEERAHKAERAAAARQAEESRWSSRFRSKAKGVEYEWRVKRLAGDR